MLKVCFWEVKVDSWNFQWWFSAQVRLHFSSMACELTPTYTYVTHDFKNVSTPSYPLTTRRA